MKNWGNFQHLLTHNSLCWALYVRIFLPASYDHLHQKFVCSPHRVRTTNEHTHERNICEKEINHRKLKLIQTKVGKSWISTTKYMGYINILVSEVYAHANDKRSHKISAPENHEELKGRLYFKEDERARDKVEIYKWNFSIVYVRVLRIGRASRIT